MEQNIIIGDKCGHMGTNETIFWTKENMFRTNETIFGTITEIISHKYSGIRDIYTHIGTYCQIGTNTFFFGPIRIHWGQIQVISTQTLSYIGKFCQTMMKYSHIAVGKYSKMGVN